MPDKEVKLEKEFKLKNEFEVPSYDDWKEKVTQDLKGAPFDKKLITHTYEGINLQPIYTIKDRDKLPVNDSIPGFSNYMRGTKAQGYNDAQWEICQELPYGDAEDFNAALKNDLQRGQTAINIILDSATQLGLDADYADINQVGDCGLSISALNSFSKALEGIDLYKYPIYIQAGFSSNPMLMILSAFTRKNSIDLKKLKGSVEADPIGYLVTRSHMPTKVKFTFDRMKLSVNWSEVNAPGIKTIGISGLPYNSSGANSVQELAFVMATAVDYITQLLKRDVPINTIAKNIRFTLSIGPNYFMEIAKFRAARVIWSNILEAYGADEDLRKMTIHGRTSTFNQTIYDPYVNMLRTTTEAFSAIVGGVDSLHTNTFDESFKVPDLFSRRIARNTQIILSEESHLNQVIDPAGGSYYVECLTNEIAEKAWSEFQEVEKQGGMLTALKAGYPQNEIEKVVGVRNKDIRKRKNVIVGINNYVNNTEKQSVISKPDQRDLHERRSKYLQDYRVAGDNKKHGDIINKLNKMVDLDSNELINLGAEAFLAGATLGEITHAARASSDESVSIPTLRFHRASEIFEELRNKSFEYEERTGVKPKVFLATLGAVKEYKGRADFSRAFFEVGGFDVIYPIGLKDVDQVINKAKESAAEIIVICSTDEKYPELVPIVVNKLKEKGSAARFVLAGYPADQIEEHKANGVDEFIFFGCDAYAILSSLHDKVMNLA